MDEAEKLCPPKVSRETFVSVDPGIRHTGVAIWRNGKLDVSYLLELPKRKSVTWCQAATATAKAFTELREIEYDIGHMWIELPIYMGSSVGHAAAVRGDIIKLSVLVGMLMQIWTSVPAQHGHPAWCIPVDVRTWKGQLPKAAVNAQIVHLLGKPQCADLCGDEWDAVGLGLWVMGLFPLGNRNNS